MRSDRILLLRELNRISGPRQQPKVAHNSLARLREVERKLAARIQVKSARIRNAPPMIYPQDLPILSKKTEIVDAIRTNQVVVITGETGSGKTTQIPKMCIEAGRGTDGMIGCTQPRRIAAMTVSQRIAEELRQEVGAAVGYKIRFDDKSSRENLIKVMTDGILLMETQHDPYLNEYDTLIVDEAHERSINIDFILGILKTLLAKRKDLSLIITSATIDTEKFSRAFDNAPVIEVSGRMFPVELRYMPIEKDNDDQDDSTYIDAAVHAVSVLKKERHREDMLLFMPTEQDIRETCDMLAAKHYKDTVVMPLFGRLSARDQRRVFMSTREQKIVVATNVAETSITIPGIKYVIDTGLARISEYNPRTRTRGLPIKVISKSSADQRMGRCGRVQNGICIRLYSEDDYENRPLFTSPEILRSNLAEVILRMLALKMDNVTSFPFVDPPNPKHIKDGFEILEELDAIRPAVPGKRKGPVSELTSTGKQMARMPIDPRISRMIIEAKRQGCIHEVLIIASALSIQDPRERPLDKETLADRAHTTFQNPSSDFMTLYNLWTLYHEKKETLKTQNRMRKFCKDHFLSYRRMREWCDVFEQISSILSEDRIRTDRKSTLQGENLYSAIHKSILSGYLSNIAIKDERNIYRKAKGKEFMIFPGSGLFNKGGPWIVAAELVETSRLFGRTVATIKSEWLEEIGGNLCRYSYFDPRWSRKRGEVVATEQVSLFGLVIVPGRQVSYGRIDPEEASRIFVQQALIEDELGREFSFLTHNRRLIDTITNMEDKIRRRDILVGENELASFYTVHLKNIYDIRTLQKLIRDRETEDFLKMKEDDIRRYLPEEIACYPDSISLGTLSIPCTYNFALGMPEDGLTIQVPADVAATISLESADWLVPGLLKEKIVTLIKGLPKKYRKALVPVAQTADTILNEMKREERPLLSTLSAFIYERFGIDIPASVWPQDMLPEYLTARIAVVDPKGNEIFATRNMRDLRTKFKGRQDESSHLKKTRSTWEKKNLTTWDFGELPDHIDIPAQGGFPHRLFPALVAGEGFADLTLFKVRQDADKAHPKGVAALYTAYFRKELDYLKKSISLKGPLKTWANYFGGAQRIENAVYDKVIHILFERPVRSQVVFMQHAAEMKPQILMTGQTILSEIEPIMAAYHEVRSTLHGLEQSHRHGKLILAFIRALRDDLNRLMPDNFLEIYEGNRLPHLPRYMKALAIRSNRGIIHLEKDRAKAEDFRPFAERRTHFLDEIHVGMSQEKRQAVDEFYWMVEEFKVSVFAQELKTAFPISRKRLERKIKEIERMV